MGLEVTRLQTIGRRGLFAWPIVDLWYLLPTRFWVLKNSLGVKEKMDKYMENKSAKDY